MAAEYLERMGQRIRERREELGLSRADVAREMPGKTNENQVYRWERGLHRPQDDALEALARVLKVDGIAYFLAPAPDKSVTPDLSVVGSEGEPDQLDRIEEKLNRMLAFFGLEQAIAEEPTIQDQIVGMFRDAAAQSQRPAQPRRS